MQAIWDDDIATIRATIGWNNVDTPDEHGIRPLQKACLKAYPNFDIVSHLLGFGASVNFDVGTGFPLDVAPRVPFVDALRHAALKNPHQQDALHLVENVVLKNHLTNTLANPPSPPAATAAASSPP